MKNKNILRIANEFKKEAVVPFWMWNDKLEKEKLKRQLLEIKEKGMNQVIIHPRFGLETPYLSEEWFDAVGFVLEEAASNKMKIWIYDELNWPSGYAGGKLLKKDPNLCGKHLVKTSKGYKVKKTSWKPAYSTDRYIDVLNPETTNSFIDLVYEEYWRRFKKYFGKVIVGFFTDEPGMYNNFADSDPNSIPWTENLPKHFKKINGYSLEKSLDFIFENQGHRSIEIRIDYWKTISKLYQESYFKPIQEWCHKRGVLFIGHVLTEEDMVNTARTQGNFFATMKYLDFAGYDLLSQLEPSALITSNLANSARKVFNLYGVTAETFGVFGWDLTRKEMDEVVKWQAQQGLTVLIPHALFYSLRGERYHDCPPSFMAHKFWRNFDKFVKSTKRVFQDTKLKKPKTAIYYPIESVWGYLSPGDTKQAYTIDKAFQAASFACFNINVEFDYLPDFSIENDSLDNYKFLILPKSEIISIKVLEKISQFIQKGGKVICMCGKPKFASKVSEQKRLKNLWKEIEKSVLYIDLPNAAPNQTVKSNFKVFIKNLLTKNLSPIWYARGIRVAKKFGYKKAIRLNKITGIENQLKLLLR